MSVLFVNPPNRPFTERSLLIEPIDVLSVATFARTLGRKVRLIDMDVKNLLPAQMKDLFGDWQPRFTVILFDYHIPLFTSECVVHVRELARLAKSAGSRVILGGKMAQHYPLLFADGNTDVIIRHETEPALKHLLSLSDFTASDLANVPGITYFVDGEPVTTADPTETVNLASLPIPDRGLVDLDDYIDVRTLLSSRGCQLKCTFCPTPDFWGNWRARSPEQVVDEIETLVTRHAARKILFLDDNATASKLRMTGISREIIRRKIEARLGCLGTAATYDADVVELMFQAGFRWIHYGIESGSQRVLDRIKKATTVARMREAILGTKALGLRTRTSWIFDLPGTTGEDIDASIDLILETEPEEVRAHFLSLRSGSELHRQVSDQDFPSQYIHHDSPSTGTVDAALLKDKMAELSEKLGALGYFVVSDPAKWRDVSGYHKRDPRMRFLSFCPMRYGMNWDY